MVNSSTAPLAVGVVGTGWIGGEHLADLAARSDVQIVAVADRNLEQADRYGQLYGARSYSDHGQLLATEQLDALWVCTPPQHHLRPTVDALEAGLAVYLEKPIGRSLDEALQITEAAERASVVCAVGYQWHSLDVLDALRSVLSDQQIGFLLGQSIGPTQSRSWFLQRSESGGNLLERGSHHIDLIRAVAGEVASVQAVASSVALGHGDADGRDIEDALTLILHLTSGAIATVVIAWTQPDAPSNYSLDVVATDGVFRLDLDPHFKLSGVSRGAKLAVESRSAPFSRSNSRFLEAVRTEDATLVACTPRDAMRTLAVAAAGEQALATGQKVSVT